MKEIGEVLRHVKEHELYPDVKVVHGVSSDPEVIVDGKKVLLFCSANYLGLANDKKVKEAVIEGIKRYGIHPAGARLVSGTLDIHEKLEKETAKFKNSEDAIIFTTGVLANLGVVPAIINLPNFGPSSLNRSLLSVFSSIKRSLIRNEAAIFSDELNHASIIDGCRLAKGQRFIYRHCDPDDLKKKLKNCKAKRKLITTDGVFSMDGDIAPLPEIIALAKKYDAMLMVDDAHATGVLGENGKGTSEYFGLEEGIDIQMGTFSKAFGVLGGFIAGEKDLIEYLRISARTYIFSGAFLGSLALGALKALEIAKKEKERRYRLWENSNYLRDNLKNRGFNILNSKDTPIIPILIGEEEKAINMAKELFENGIFAPCIRWPAVAKNESRIRISVITTHTKEQLDYLINVLEQLGSKYNITKK